jgi:hypothetical protein
MLDSSLASTKARRDPETGNITSERVEGAYEFDEASGKLQNFWRPKGVTNPANEATITQWLAQNGLSGVSIPFFINTSQFSQFRAKAIKELKF